MEAARMPRCAKITSTGRVAVNGIVRTKCHQRQMVDATAGQEPSRRRANVIQSERQQPGAAARRGMKAGM